MERVIFTFNFHHFRDLLHIKETNTDSKMQIDQGRQFFLYFILTEKMKMDEEHETSKSIFQYPLLKFWEEEQN